MSFKQFANGLKVGKQSPQSHSHTDSAANLQETVFLLLGIKTLFEIISLINANNPPPTSAERLLMELRARRNRNNRKKYGLEIESKPAPVEKPESITTKNSSHV